MLYLKTYTYLTKRSTETRNVPLQCKKYRIFYIDLLAKTNLGVGYNLDPAEVLSSASPPQIDKYLDKHEIS